MAKIDHQQSFKDEKSFEDKKSFEEKGHLKKKVVFLTSVCSDVPGKTKSVKSGLRRQQKSSVLSGKRPVQNRAFALTQKATEVSSLSSLFV